MLDAATVADLVHDQEDKDRGHEDDHWCSPVGTQPAASLYQRSVVEGMVETTAICRTSSTTEMHAIGLEANAMIGSVMSRSSTMRGTMTMMTPTLTNLSGNIL
jgi:hypothetical protein